MRRSSIGLGISVCLLTLASLGSWSVGAHPADRPDAAPPAAPRAALSKAPYTPPPMNVTLRSNSWQVNRNIDPATAVDQRLLTQWAQDPTANLGFVVYLQAQADTTNSISDWNAKGAYVLQQLETVANATQPSVIQALTAQQGLHNVTSVTRFTIINAIFVHGNAAAARELARRPDVAYVEADHRYYPLTGAISAPAGGLLSLVPQSAPETIELGVQTVHAPQVWATGVRGQGIVVGHIDTGVQYDHPALVRQYRGNLGGGNFNHNYNWWDTSVLHSATPYDDNEHGTHTMGTILGKDASQTNQIGVAPAAQWITAKVFPAGGSSGNEEITPAEDFMLAPWDLNGQNRDPSKRPRLVSNSWGDNECVNTDSVLITEAWIDAGIIPVFANGNAGPGVGTVGSPGGYPFNIGVGAISASSMTIAGFSSRGPSCYGGVIKPDVVAPGVNIRSSFPASTYGTISGTSMATPHTAGMIALLLSANPSLVYTDVFSIITRTAYFQPSWGTRPNNNYGWGLVQADTAVDMALHAARVTGTASGNSVPLGGINITAVRQSDSDTYQVNSDTSGNYHLYLRAGTYNLTASKFGYQPQMISAQSFLSDTTTTLNLNLTPATTFPVSGQLLLANACTPISGTVKITPPGTLTVTAASGVYTTNLPAGTYTLEARAGAAYQPVSTTITVSGPTTHDFTFGAAHDGSYVVDAPAYTWISGTNQLTFQASGGADPNEDGFANTTLPFPFTYYGASVTALNVGVNGYASFNPIVTYSEYANTTLPNPGPTPAPGDAAYPNNALYPYWDDLAIAPRFGTGVIYTATTGTAPNRIYVVEWRNVAGAGAPITFEIQLEESTNRITFAYQNVAAPYGYGYSATEGIENATGTDGIMFGFNETGIIGNNRAYRFTPGQAPVITPCGAPTATVTTVPTATPVPPTATAVPPTATATTAAPTVTATRTAGVATATPNATATPCTLSFSDVTATDYFYTPVLYLACHGVISGYSDGSFRPYNPTTRAQLAKIVVGAEGWSLVTPATPHFSDVPTSNVFYAFVETAYAHGIISGYSDGTFLPSNPVTRGQLSKIVVGAQGWPLVTPATPHFSDVPAGYIFYSAIETAYAHGIISGYNDGTFGPGNSATRGQIAKIVYLALQSPPVPQK